MTIARVLPFAEWERLPESLDPMLAAMAPGSCRVCVVEEDGEIVAHWLLFPVLHAECVWIAPKKRKGSVARRLLRIMKAAAKDLGFDRVWSNTTQDDVTQLMSHPALHALIVPGLPFVIPVGE